MILPPLTFETHDTRPLAEADIVDRGLEESNRAAAPLNDVRALTCIARAPSGDVVGGAVGRTWGECAELQQLWVAPEHRRNGIGSNLVKLFESRAEARGCRTLYLTTFSFQAPALYESLGYRAVAELRGFPMDIVKYLMVRVGGPMERRSLPTSPAGGSSALRVVAVGAQALGALALGALAVGALAIGALAIGRLAIGRTRIRRVEIDELVVRRLRVTDDLQLPPKD